eukprot:TRINITY_DN2710_c1_g1_i1.p1 TRINITY_DN2710_c1_g1~~TRINITY_DN2710_c1_g1_i1.p1  ORF type:complete len:943 (+),score=426.34 TRINITY_DN2710_c1_g1_i1:112-2940(+)
MLAFTTKFNKLSKFQSFKNNSFLNFSQKSFFNKLRPDTAPGSLKGNGVIGIRREDKNRWERRAPLAPPHVATLVSRGVQVVLQPSTKRVFSDEEYKQAGAIIQEDIGVASTILGVKELPRNLLIPERTYMFFSHTIKAQSYNMPLLDDIISNNIRLIDYERVVDDHNNRLIRFGKFAGYAGMIDYLHILGNRLLALGHSTPFLHMGYAHMYNSLESAFNAVFSMGREIANQGIPAELNPLVFVFSGTGSTSQGSQEVFRMLPHKFVSVDELEQLVKSKKADNKIVYGVIASSDTYIVPKNPSKKFTRKDYYANPQNYVSLFKNKIAPYISCLINCVYWDQRYPRLITTEEIEESVRRKNTRLIGVADISCDVEGAVEFMKKTTTIDHPIFLYDVKNRKIHEDIEGDGIVFLAIDNLPSELPREASKYFGDNLMPWVEELAVSNGELPIEQQQKELPGELYRAVITSHGKLTPLYEYITELRKRRERMQKKNRILVLGAGYVASPLIEYLSRSPLNMITIAATDAWRAETLAKERPNVDSMFFDVVEGAKSSGEKSKLSHLISSYDIVVSLVPAPLHPTIAKECIKQKKHMVTASYISPAMKELDDEAKAAGVTILNEIGLDPGIDHLSAMKIIKSIQDDGGKVLSFVSWCGGLPAPECSDNPLAYKFSWSPRGVLAALKNPAKYLMNGKLIEVASGSLFDVVKPVEVYKGFNLEGYPNRDSLTYSELYGIPDVKTMLRGTLRYRGFSEIMKILQQIGLLNEEVLSELENETPITWRDLLEKLNPGTGKLEHRIINSLDLDIVDDKAQEILAALQWFGILGSKQVQKKRTAIDSFCALLEEKLKFGIGERDLVILQHIFRIQDANGKEKRMLSTLVEYGDPNGYSAMARTVGLPTAIATKMILDGTIIRKGVIAPVTPDIFVPLLSGLEKEGIVLNEKVIEEF